MVSDKNKELQSDKEPYWRWEYKCGARAMGHDLIRIPMQVLVTTYETGALVDLPLTYLAPVLEHHFDQAVVSELNRRETDVAFQVLWNGINQLNPCNNHQRTLR